MLQSMDTVPPTVPLRVQSCCIPVSDGMARANKELTNRANKRYPVLFESGPDQHSSILQWHSVSPGLCCQEVLKRCGTCLQREVMASRDDRLDSSCLTCAFNF